MSGIVCHMRHHCEAAFALSNALSNSLSPFACGLTFLAFAAVEETHL